MATLNDFFKVNLIDDHTAEDMNKLIAAVLRAEFRNVETITVTKELEDDDCQFQNITASGADQTVELPPIATTNHLHVISNVGASNNVPVKDSTGATTYAMLAPSEWCIAVPNGSAWLVIDSNILGWGSFVTAQGRLTLQSGVPVSSIDQTAKTTIYYSPYVGNKLTLYDGALWNQYNFSELSLSLAGLTANKNFDIFVYDSAGTLALEAAEWTDDTTRATSLVRQDGILVKSGAATRLYLGTIRTTGTTGQCEDSNVHRFVWNMYNRVPRRPFKQSSVSHTYTTAAYRAWNNDATQIVDFVVGDFGVDILAFFGASAVGAAVAWRIGVGFNTVSAVNTNAYIQWQSAFTGNDSTGFAFPIATPGYNYISVLEFGGAGVTFTDYSLRCTLMM